MAVVDVNALIFERFKLTASSFNAGRDDDTQVSSGEVAEVATGEVGSTGNMSNYDAIQVGQPATTRGGDIQGNEPYVDMEAGGDVNDTAEWAFAVRRKGELSAGADGMITGFRSQRAADKSDPRKRSSMPPQEPVAKDGRVLQWLAKDETANLTVDLSESTLELPCLGGK